MNIIADCVQIHAQTQAWKSAHQKVALVPTMGNLHDGHLSLVRQAKTLADRVIVSIYVNALQFNQQEDFKNYPRTLADDLEKLEMLEVDVVFMPDEQDLYPYGIQQAPRIFIPELSKEFCGKYRPGHFEGVCTVVTKLFNLTLPDIAVFGQKDYQQLLIIRRMTEELCFNIEISAGNTVREADGLAMSSRNNHLSDELRALAPRLYSTLCWARNEFDINRINDIELKAKNTIEKQGFKYEYLSIRDADTLQEIKQNSKNYVVLAAAWLGKTRLIDNIVFQ
jgi:pantoate--beta-alanine ligase